MNIEVSDSPYLAGHLLVAMPGMPDPRFAKSVIYMCAHNADGAMGLVVNRAINDVTFPELLKQLGIETGDEAPSMAIQFGGPVEEGRGFVLHSADYIHDTTMVVEDDVALTATVDILRDIALGHGPQCSLLALGYAGWGPGQLDQEILQNGWLSVKADTDLLFATDIQLKWSRALEKLGIDLSLLSEEAGHA